MDKQYDIFICYRRIGGDVMARLLYLTLTGRGYSVFYDHESIRTGDFHTVIDNAIKSCNEMIVVLSPHMFDDKAPDNDEVLRELKLAATLNKTILPLQMDGFAYPENYPWPDELYNFPRINAPAVNIGTFDFEYLKKFMTSAPSNLDETITSFLELANSTSVKYDNINENVRNSSLKYLIQSYMGRENTDMIYDMINPYLNRQFNEKKDFLYELHLQENNSRFDKLNFENVYYPLSERLSFKKTYINQARISDFWIAFDFGDDSLDNHLRRENILFSESLKLKDADIAKLRAIPEEVLQDYYVNLFKIQVAINNSRLYPDNIEKTESGIAAHYVLSEPVSHINFKISFVIPFDIEGNDIYVAISEPTYNPHIILRYDDIFRIDMMPFFDASVTLESCSSIDGEYEIYAYDSWVMPMSGAVFNAFLK